MKNTIFSLPLLLLPPCGETTPGANLAAETFNSLHKKVTGTELEIIRKDDGKSDLIIIGDDTLNHFVHKLVMEDVLPPLSLKIGSDAYMIKGLQWGARKLLILAGARTRSLLYAVYHFFEQAASCRYFWDGDIIPQKESLDYFSIDIEEKPRFQYRGLAYCPHRSLARFQPEQWDLTEWKREIDYLLKKRFNTFWMRLGIEDLFQQAFPDKVKDHGYECPGAPRSSYDDRRLFWPLEYRKKLKQEVLAYAYERDLYHPQEAGAFTHWDTYTPQDFLEKEDPTFLANAPGGHLDKRHIHWDIREDRNLNNYFAVMEAGLELGTRPEIFYIRGISERACYTDHRKNTLLKLYCYKRMISKIRSKYPFAQIWFHNWDLMCNKWEAADVRELLQLMEDPNIHMLSFTNDVEAGPYSITEWGVPRTFPYLCAFFVANMPDSEIRGAYDLMELRVDMAAKDPMCHGLLIWPEASHVDNFIQEYISRNGWDPKYIKADSLINAFCCSRYQQHNEELLPELQKLWHRALAVFRKHRKIYRDPNNSVSGFSLAHILGISFTLDARDVIRARNCFHNYLAPLRENAPEIFRTLGELAERKDLSPFLFRDMGDLGKTLFIALSSCLRAKTCLLMEDFRNGEEGAKEALLRNLSMRKESLELFVRLLAANKENSLYDSLCKIPGDGNHPWNKDFEEVLKGNAVNSYCRGYITEVVQYIYCREEEHFAGWVKEGMQDPSLKQWKRPSSFSKVTKELEEEFYARPLAEKKPDEEKALLLLPETFRKLSLLVEKFVEEEIPAAGKL